MTVARQDEDRELRRLMRFLAGGPATVAPASQGKGYVLESDAGGAIAVTQACLAKAAGSGAVIREGARLCLAKAETAAAARPGPAVNDRESPLAQLVRHRMRDGRPFLDDAERRAGERLRSDYTRAAMMPRLGANWTAAVASGRRAQGQGAAADMTDGQLAARQRVDRALSAVGPELSGVLVDICCFLKGLSVVEIERGWPVRSAKVVLKTGLAALARHYEPERPSRTRADILHWGSGDFRPELRSGGR